VTKRGGGSRRPIILNACVDLNRWIEAGGSPEHTVRFRGMQHRWSGFWFERHAKITAQRCAMVELPSNPVFIVGLWRTGSTVLHAALSHETGWTTPRTWQCFRPADFLLMPPPTLRRAARPMDAGIVDTFSPQEDEFASLLLGEPSTYRAFIDPRRFDELTKLLADWRSPAAKANVPLSDRWETFLRAVLTEHPGPLLLKSPNHTFRLPWLAQRFPDARFLWLTRRTDDVMQSNRRMWAAMVDRYGQWRLDPAALERFLRHAVSNHDDLLDWARAAIADRLLVLHFDDVIRDTKAPVARILEYLGAGSKLA